MFQTKTPKSQEPYKAVLVGHNPHTVPLTQRNWPDRIRIISIDPGTTHYAIRVEERNIKMDDRIVTLHFDKVGLKAADQELTIDMVSPVYSFISNYLDRYLELFKTCHVVIIEKQLPKNYRAVRMSQHTLSYFMIHLKNLEPLAMIMEVKPQLKGKELGVPPNLNERGLKLWAVEKATELCEMRGDGVSLKVLSRKDPTTNRKEKKDDLSDTICQIEAICSNFGWPLTKPINTINTTKPRINKPVLNITPKNNSKPVLNITSKNNSKPVLNIK